MDLDCRSSKLLQWSLAAKDEAEFPLDERSEEEEAPGWWHHQRDYTSVPASNSPLSSTRPPPKLRQKLGLPQFRNLGNLWVGHNTDTYEGTKGWADFHTVGVGHRAGRMTCHMSLTLSYFAMFGLHTSYLAHGSLSQFQKPGSHQRCMTTHDTSLPATTPAGLFRHLVLIGFASNKVTSSVTYREKRAHLKAQI